MNLALVGCNAGSCTLVVIFTWAQRAGEVCLVLGRRMGLASFLGWLRAKWFHLCWFPLSTCTESPGAPGRRQTDRHEAHTFDGYVNLGSGVSNWPRREDKKFTRNGILIGQCAQFLVHSFLYNQYFRTQGRVYCSTP